MIEFKGNKHNLDSEYYIDNGKLIYVRKTHESFEYVLNAQGEYEKDSIERAVDEYYYQDSIIFHKITSSAYAP